MNTMDKPRISQQKRGGTRISFSAGDRLDYRFESSMGISISKTVEWEAMPSSLHFVENVEPNQSLRYITIVTTGISLVAVLEHPSRPLQTLCFYAIFSLGLVCAVHVLGRRRRTATTSLPVADGNVIVLRDKLHDQIIEEMATRRKRRLAALGAIRADQSARQNLRRLRWLVTEGAMSHEQFEAAQAALAPRVSVSLIKEPFRLKSPRCFIQRRMGVRCVWDLLPDRVRYQHSTSFGDETTLNVSYQELPRHREFDQVIQRSWVVFLPIAWFYAVLSGMMEQMDHARPARYYIGWIGARHAALDFAPIFAALGLGLAVITWQMVVRSSRLRPGITVIRDRQHDSILNALEQARLAALRWELQPDPLIPLDEYAQLLEHMKAELDLSEEQYRAWLAQARAMDEELRFDRPHDPMITRPSQKVVN